MTNTLAERARRYATKAHAPSISAANTQGRAPPLHVNAAGGHLARSKARVVRFGRPNKRLATPMRVQMAPALRVAPQKPVLRVVGLVRRPAMSCTLRLDYGLFICDGVTVNGGTRPTNPYIVHPQAVMELVRSVPHTEEMLAAARCMIRWKTRPPPSAISTAISGRRWQSWCGC